MTPAIYTSHHTSPKSKNPLEAEVNRDHEQTDPSRESAFAQLVINLLEKAGAHLDNAASEISKMICRMLPESLKDENGVVLPKISRLFNTVRNSLEGAPTKNRSPHLHTRQTAA
jgi:hypothetical protein